MLVFNFSFAARYDSLFHWQERAMGVSFYYLDVSDFFFLLFSLFVSSSRCVNAVLNSVYKCSFSITMQLSLF